jgi:hypothetical protein
MLGAWRVLTGCALPLARGSTHGRRYIMLSSRPPWPPSSLPRWGRTHGAKHGVKGGSLKRRARTSTRWGCFSSQRRLRRPFPSCDHGRAEGAVWVGNLRTREHNWRAETRKEWRFVESPQQRPEPDARRQHAQPGATGRELRSTQRVHHRHSVACRPLPNDIPLAQGKVCQSERAPGLRLVNPVVLTSDRGDLAGWGAQASAVVHTKHVVRR